MTGMIGGASRRYLGKVFEKLADSTSRKSCSSSLLMKLSPPASQVDYGEGAPTCTAPGKYKRPWLKLRAFSGEPPTPTSTRFTGHSRIAGVRKLNRIAGGSGLPHLVDQIIRQHREGRGQRIAPLERDRSPDRHPHAHRRRRSEQSRELL